MSLAATGHCIHSFRPIYIIPLLPPDLTANHQAVLSKIQADKALVKKIWRHHIIGTTLPLMHSYHLSMLWMHLSLWWCGPGSSDYVISHDQVECHMTSLDLVVKTFLLSLICMFISLENTLKSDHFKHISVTLKDGFSILDWSLKSLIMYRKPNSKKRRQFFSSWSTFKGKERECL